METELEAVNGRRVRAIEVFAHALHFFREHALKVHFHAPAQWWTCLYTAYVCVILLDMVYMYKPSPFTPSCKR